MEGEMGMCRLTDEARKCLAEVKVCLENLARGRGYRGSRGTLGAFTKDREPLWMGDIAWLAQRLEECDVDPRD